MIRGLRPAREADLEALLRLEHQCLPDEPWTAAMLRAELDRAAEGPGWLAVVDGEDGSGPVAMCAGWAAGRTAELLRLAVDPAHRRRGLARALLAGLEAHARGAGATEVWLEVRSDNASAIALYEGAGYRATGRRPSYYGAGRDALIYRRALLSS